MPSATPATDADADGFSMVEDCNDSNSAQFPGNPETCDGQDNDCSGEVDEGLLFTAYADKDLDGYGDPLHPIVVCALPDAAALTADDCDDTHEGRYPGAPPACDGSDNNCDGTAERLVRVYLDQDGDGFGNSSKSRETCAPAENETQTSSDCNDGDASIHPGQVDVAGDSRDSDCGGTDAPQPCVGYGTQCQATLQDALAAGTSGTVLFVAPGRYEASDLSFSGKTLALVAPAGPALTLVDGTGSALPLFRFESGETPSTRLSGFALTGSKGSGVRISSARPTLERLEIYGNTGERGGGMQLVSAAPVLKDLLIRDNTATSLYEGGGGLHLDRSSPSLDFVTIQGNHAAGGDGGGLYLTTSHPTLTHIRVLNNEASRYGGGMYLNLSNPSISHAEIMGNDARLGGGLYLQASSPEVLQSVVLDNRALVSGGGIYLYQSSTAPLLVNSLLAWNAGGLIYNGSSSSPAVPFFQSCLFFAPFSSWHNLETFMGDGNMGGDPLLEDFVADLMPDDLLIPLPGSLMVDGGDPALRDLDGSISDIGLYGGAGADPAFLADEDFDGQPDRWEILNGLDPTVLDQDDDRDQDGLSNGAEQDAGLDPRRRDSDHDGAADGQELNQGTDPLDWYSAPQAQVAKVPGDFPTLQDAVNAVRTEGTISLQAGERDESVWVAHRAIRLSGAGPDTSILKPTAGRPLRVQNTQLELQGVRLSGGHAGLGANLYLAQSAGSISAVRFDHGLATQDTAAAYASGGGAFLLESTFTLSDVQFAENDVQGDRALGGGLSAEQSTLSVAALQCWSNRAGSAASTLGAGGALYLENTVLTLTGTTLEGNVASKQGGGIYASRSSGSISQGWLLRNGVDGVSTAGGGLYLLSSPLQLSHLWLEGNYAQGTGTVMGGALYGKGTAARLEYLALAGNTAISGGGIAWVSASLELSHCVVAENDALYGGGLFGTGTGLTIGLENVIFAQSSASNVYISSPDETPQGANSCTLQAPVGTSSTNSPQLESLCASTAAGFLSLDEESGYDLHLAADSLLVDAGTGDTDLDESLPDPGVYGGPGGALWDLDRDDVPLYFWPGMCADAPSGSDLVNFECAESPPETPFTLERAVHKSAR